MNTQDNYALDKLLPIINIYLDNGRTWQVDGITYDVLTTHKTAPISLSPDIKVYYDQLVDILSENKHLFAKNSTGAPQHFVARPNQPSDALIPNL